MKIAVIDDYQDSARSLADWARLDGEVHFFHEHVADEDALIASLAPFDVVCIMRERTRFPRRVLTSLPQLRLLVTSGMRNNAVDLDAARTAGITVCGTNVRGGATLELAWALILALVRGIVREDRALRAGRWQTALGMQLSGKTLGIVGLGNIGGAMARVARAFDMDVLAWSRSLTDEAAAERGARRASTLIDLMRTSDVVTVHAALNASSQGLIGHSEIAAMKADAYLVNTARAALVDYGALADALRERRIAGAAVDVFDREPVIGGGEALFGLDNTVVTPHLGYASLESFRAFYTQMVEDIESWAQGRPVRVLT